MNKKLYDFFQIKSMLSQRTITAGCCLLFSILSSLAYENTYEFSYDGLNYEIIDGYSCRLVYGADLYSGDVIIPEKVFFKGQPYNVTEIDECAFTAYIFTVEERTHYSNPTLTSVSLPLTLTKIGKYAFAGCSGLSQVDIPASVTSIGEEAFAGCSSLTQVNIPASVTSIGAGAFARCFSLIHVDLPDFLKSIENNSFYGCSELTYIEIPESVETIGNGAFSYCSSLTLINIPEKVHTIGSDAFFHCSGLTSIRVPKNVSEIGYGAFSYCENLTEISVDEANPFYVIYKGVLYNKDKTELVSYPASITDNTFFMPSTTKEVGPHAFAGNKWLELISINKVERIGEEAFLDCGLSDKLSINGNSLLYIDSGAFKNCSDLKSIVLPESLQWVALNAFQGCSNLDWVGIKRQNQYFTSKDGVLMSKDETELLIYPEGKTAGSYEIPSSVTTIGYSAFEGNIHLEVMDIPSTVTEIKSGAFENCSGLSQINLPNSISEIDEGTFSGCTSLKQINIPNSVMTIGDFAFQGCEGLKSITLPNTLQSIKYYSFYNCTALEHFTIPSSIKYLDSNIFTGCSSLSSITYLASVPKELYSWTFEPEIYENVTLNYLNSARMKIEVTEPWCNFVNRVGRDADFIDAISEVHSASSESTAVYDLNGVKVGNSVDGLPHGVYIIRKGSVVTKKVI